MTFNTKLIFRVRPESCKVLMYLDMGGVAVFMYLCAFHFDPSLGILKSFLCRCRTELSVKKSVEQEIFAI